jgi:hypothetical protein
LPSATTRASPRGKKFGPTVLQQADIAVDPRHDDHAWFLVGGAR